MNKNESVQYYENEINKWISEGKYDELMQNDKNALESYQRSYEYSKPSHFIITSRFRRP